jgi:hypothetical protein
MIRYITVTIFFLSTICVLKAQETKTQNTFPEKKRNEIPKGWVGVSIGPSFPVGVMANTDPLSEKSGYATTGVQMNLNVGYKFEGNIGICALLHSGANKINKDAFEKLLSMSVPAGYSGTYSIEPWQMGGLLIGPYITIPSAGNTYFFIRGLVGYTSVTTPSYTITLNKPNTQPVTATTKSKDFDGLGYSLGAGANIVLSQKVQLMLNMDFISTSVTVRNITTTFSNNSPAVTGTSYEQPYSVINITGGIAYIIR